MKNDILYHKKKNDQVWCLVIPCALQRSLVIEVHERIGHMGAYKTFKHIAKNYYWIGIRKYIKRLIMQCDLCQYVKALNYKMEGRFQNVISESPGDTVAIDFFGPLPQSIGGVKYIFVVLDIFSKFVYLYAIRRETTDAAIRKMEDCFRVMGKPRRVLCDNGSQFISPNWGIFLERSGVQSAFISIRHPQSNPAERVMRELGRLFRTYCSDRHTK